jgi:penicillin amidase
MRSPLLEPGDLTPAGLALMRARNQPEFQDAMRAWSSPSLCFVYADVDGGIGVQIAGKAPRRPPGTGTGPAPGYSRAYEWQGYLDFEELPAEYTPPEGQVVTANNKPAPDQHAAPLLGEWSDGFRAARIAQVLASGNKLTVDAMRALQMDVQSLAAAEFQSELAHAAHRSAVPPLRRPPRPRLRRRSAADRPALLHQFGRAALSRTPRPVTPLFLYLHGTHPLLPYPQP